MNCIEADEDADSDADGRIMHGVQSQAGRLQGTEAVGGWRSIQACRWRCFTC